MNQTGSSFSQLPPHVHVFGPKTVLVAAVICVAIGGGWLWLANQFNTQADIAKEQKGQTEQLAASVEEREEVLQSKISDLRQELETALSAVNSMQKAVNSRNLAITLVSVNADELVRRIEQVEDALTALKDRRNQWETERQEGLTSDRGQLGSSEELVQAFVNLKLNPLLADEELKSWEATLQKLKDALVPVRDGTAGELADVPPGFETKIADIEASVRAEGDRLSSMQSMLARAIQANPNPTPQNAPPLRQAVAQREEELKRQRQAAIEAAAQQVRNELTEVLAAERAKTERLLAEQRKELELRYREAELNKQKVEEEIKIQTLADATEDAKRAETQRLAERGAALEREAKERAFRAALPEIKRYLIPFITDGNTQPLTTYSKYGTSASTGPVSLSRLKAHGIFDDTTKALVKLHELGASVSNDRPQGAFPPYIGGSMVKPEQVPFFKKVQSLLREHGDMMVEKGLLLP